jgi:hypothetical protein
VPRVHAGVNGPIRMALEYQQPRGVPSSCFGETEHFVTGVGAIGRKTETSSLPNSA